MQVMTRATLRSRRAVLRLAAGAVAPGPAVVIPNVIGGTFQIAATDNVNATASSFTVPFGLTLTPAAGRSRRLRHYFGHRLSLG